MNRMKKILTITITLIMVQFTTLVAVGSDDVSSPDFARSSSEPTDVIDREAFNQEFASIQAGYAESVEAFARQEAKIAEMREQHNKRMDANQALYEIAIAEVQTRLEEKTAVAPAMPVQVAIVSESANRQVADNNVGFEEKNTNMLADYEAGVAARRADFERNRQNNYSFFAVGAAIVIVIRIIIAVSKTRRTNQHFSGSTVKSSFGFAGTSANDNYNMHNDFMMQEQNRLFQEQAMRDAQQAMDMHNNIVMQNQMQLDMDEAARFSMNSSYNAMSDANFACTGIDSFGHNPF